MSFKETEVGRIPEDWEVDNMENSLEEIIDYRGKTPEKSEKGIPTLSAKSVKDGYIDYSRAYFISKETYNKFMVRGFPKKGDILLTTEAPLGLVARLDRENIAIAQRILTLRGKKDYLVNEYLQYYLMSVVGQHQLTSKETGTTVKGIKQKEFRKCLIPLPPLKEQKAIAHILSTLDEKIEINNKINKNLESMAQEIFKHWFVDFEFPNENGKPYKSSGGEMVESEMGLIPAGWKVGCIGDYTRVKSGFAFKSKSWEEDGVSVVKIKSLQNKTIDFSEVGYVNKDKIEKSKQFLVTRGDLLIAMTGATIGKIGLVPKYKEKILVNQRVGKFFLEKEPLKKIGFLYCIINQEKIYEEIVSNGEGSAQPNISPSQIENIKIILPRSEELEKFNEVMKDKFELITQNLYENIILSSTRDTLLPKLMSGELRVPTES